MLRWPDAEAIRRAAREWASRQAALHPELIALGYFGSYARGDWGVGSDLDLVAITRDAARPFSERALDWPLEDLPLPAEILIYTQGEWDRLLCDANPFVLRLAGETVWLVGVEPGPNEPAHRRTPEPSPSAAPRP